VSFFVAQVQAYEGIVHRHQAAAHLRPLPEFVQGNPRIVPDQVAQLFELGPRKRRGMAATVRLGLNGTRPPTLSQQFEQTLPRHAEQPGDLRLRPELRVIGRKHPFSQLDGDGSWHAPFIGNVTMQT
jgi:hypothetical protein